MVGSVGVVGMRISVGSVTEASSSIAWQREGGLPLSSPFQPQFFVFLHSQAPPTGRIPSLRSYQANSVD